MTTVIASVSPRGGSLDSLAASHITPLTNRTFSMLCVFYYRALRIWIWSGEVVYVACCTARLGPQLQADG